MAGVLASTVTQSNSELPVRVTTSDIDVYRYEVDFRNHVSLGLNDDETQALVHRAVVRAVIQELKGNNT